jgi:hypothetical protein
LGFYIDYAIMLCMKRFVFSIAVLAITLFGCGDLDMALSSGKLYKANAMVNGLTLDESAILAKGSKISPYFDFNIKDDPDIDSLVVYIKDYTGKKTGPVIQYKLHAENGDSASADGDNEGETDTSGEKQGEEDSGGGESAGSAEDGIVLTEENGLYAGTAGGILAGETGDSGEDAAAVGTVSGFFAVESGTKSVVVPSDNGGEADIVIMVRDDDLPGLVLGDDLQYGVHTIVFEIIASNKTELNHIEKPFFYLAEKKLAIKEIVSFLPGISHATRIVPPGEKIMLEAGIEADSSIDPYIIWYNGKHRIDEGFVSEGKNLILWTAPVQTVFQNIRAEVFPFSPNKQALSIPGLSYDVSLPVSQRHGRNGFYSEMEAQLSHWYRLWGDLADSKYPANTALALVGNEEAAARWLPVSGTYGLAIGTDDAYRLPGSFFKQIRRSEGSGEIRLFFAPQNGEAVEGTVLHAELRGRYAETETDGVCLVWLSVYRDSLVLHASVEGGTVQVQTPLPVIGSVFVSAAIDFQFSETGTTVSIGAGNIETGAIEQWESLNIDFIASGEGNVQFGGTFEPPDSMEEPEDAYSGVLNEIGVRYNEISPSTPPPPALESVDTESVDSEENLTDDATQDTADAEMSA